MVIHIAHDFAALSISYNTANYVSRSGMTVLQPVAAALPDEVVIDNGYMQSTAGERSKVCFAQFVNMPGE
jgi:hypothetical protein